MIKMKMITSFILTSLVISAAMANPVETNVMTHAIKPGAFATIQAENYNFTTGCHFYNDCETVLVGDLGNGGIVGYYDVDFGQNTGPNNIIVRYANQATGSQFRIEVKIDTQDNLDNFVVLTPVKTDSWCDFRQISADTPYDTTSPITGLHHVYFVFYVDDISSDGPTFDSFALTITEPLGN
ncbi:hypothetical protein CHUAL_008832 [Chamberlinius hualienensis]